MKNVNLRLNSWIFVLEEVDLRSKDKRGTKNKVANHLSRLKVEAILKLKDKL